MELSKEHRLLLCTVKYFWQYWELTTAFLFIYLFLNQDLTYIF